MRRAGMFAALALCILVIVGAVVVALIAWVNSAGLGWVGFALVLAGALVFAAAEWDQRRTSRRRKKERHVTFTESDRLARRDRRRVRA